MIEIKGLQKSFANRVILNQVNLTFERGKIYALIGESGSGKTTLLNMIAKLEPYDTGEVFYDHKDIKEIKDYIYYRDYLGYLFQNFGLIESESVATNLELGLVGKKRSKIQKEEQKREVLKRVHLEHISLEQKIFELSGGESQRVALAKVFLKNPPLILADEPTAALDPSNADEVMKLLSSLKNDNRIIIVATHNPAIWEKADVVIRMEDL
ncbi:MULTISPECIES: ABC transporter ATP-binding protein [unclassified Streptococcus]|uniref:ABC transporter ATP-binding protein n=1 Tax=unclassified Streptococcus TaxID=2608887 RepID=UPI001071D26D|nr:MULTISPECIES: ABC transporter ATP-binding protein [unclassified Streptococcus]MBF0788081.1 ABC transporter ATP-binding protein [Streptococcus sp. 19428wC2_LYSM12]MCQ9211400.1 ABC transporter ATP-binding protein [Streptococcus sp. B01]MCQ9214713.1 ABC transporter ATP-binding protein [Streptococcus sp. O1]TFV04894.1 ABC transporter ATP-binding protein [Streptococcus sp. LYSM12]